MLHLRTTDNTGHCSQVAQWRLWEEGTAPQAHPPGLSVQESPRFHLLLWALLFPYGFHHGMVGGTDQEKTIAQESTHSSAWSSREKKKQLLQAATQPGTQRSWRDPSLGHELSQAHCKNSAEEIPEEK